MRVRGRPGRDGEGDATGSVVAFRWPQAGEDYPARKAPPKGTAGPSRLPQDGNDGFARLVARALP